MRKMDKYNKRNIKHIFNKVFDIFNDEELFQIADILFKALVRMENENEI